MTAKTGKNFREGGGRIFLAGQNIYPWKKVRFKKKKENTLSTKKK